MQIVQAHIHERPQLVLDGRVGKAHTGLAHREVHHLGDVQPLHLILQHLLVVAQSVAGLAGGLDVVHKGHLGHHHALAAAHRAATATIEGEVLLPHFVRPRK